MLQLRLRLTLLRTLAVDKLMLNQRGVRVSGEFWAVQSFPLPFAGLVGSAASELRQAGVAEPIVQKVITSQQLTAEDNCHIDPGAERGGRQMPALTRSHAGG